MIIAEQPVCILNNVLIDKSFTSNEKRNLLQILKTKTFDGHSKNLPPYPIRRAPVHKLAGTNQVSIRRGRGTCTTHPLCFKLNSRRVVHYIGMHPLCICMCVHMHPSTPIIIIHIRQSSHLEIVGGATRTCARAGIS